ncbi:MAG: zinc dependent phospholipase C family protein [Chloroflexota bacterium]
MPTPFMHLKVAEEMIRRPDLSPSLRHHLENHWPAFCLGQIAADFQIICDIKRSKTHFYHVPPKKGDLAAFDRMLDQFPALAQSDQLSADHAVFVAGYGAHLLYDLIWFHNIVMIFALGDWAERMARFTAHNALLAHEDGAAYPHLNPKVGKQILEVDAKGWLPFDEEGNLKAWQTLVGEQLLPKNDSQTIQIYAERMDMTTAELTANLQDQTWLDANIFDHVSRQLLNGVFEQAVTGGIDLVSNYLKL